MMMSNFFMFGTVVLFFLIGFLHIYAAFIFKKMKKIMSSLSESTRELVCS